jgi:hypothetical protein
MGISDASRVDSRLATAIQERECLPHKELHGSATRVGEADRTA